MGLEFFGRVGGLISESLVGTATGSLGVDPLFVVYVAVFSLAAVGCFAGLLRVDRITDADVQRGLTALLLTSGGWASAHVGYIAGPTPGIQHLFYVAGLIVGIATVGPWLYVCSAYTGRTLHRNRIVRRVAVGGFLGIVAIKLTNPIHGWYYSTTVVSEPFPHVLVSHEPLHWVVMGVAYALAFVGFFMLFELFLSVRYDVRPLVVLVGVTGLPIVTDVAGFTSGSLLEITYSPLGVAVFAIGVMFGYLELFEKVQFVGDEDGLAIFLDNDDCIRDVSPVARDRFPSLQGARGEPLSAVLPDVAETLASEGQTLQRYEGGTERYYHVTANANASSKSALGRIVLFSDVTEREQYRQELERQNERLEKFASMVSHDLRNPLNVAELRLDALTQRLDDKDENAAAVGRALDRMEALIDELLLLARQGQPVETTAEVSLSESAREAWTMVETEACELVVEREHHFQADEGRLQRLFENLFRNSFDHGETVTTIRVGELEDGSGFFVEDDGVGIPDEQREQVLDFGYTTDDEGTGFGLAIVSEIADAHQWTIDVTESQAGGARFEITTSVGVRTLEHATGGDESDGAD